MKDKNVNIAKCVLGQDQYMIDKECVTIGNVNYRMILQREITNDSDNKVEALCVNCFQFISENDAVNYMLNLGYDGKDGTYSFSFSKNLVNQCIDMDNIVSTPQELPIIKEYFKDHYESSRFVTLDEKDTKFEDFGEILYAMFDYCYEYLVEHGFHIAQSNKS